jgi:hypothetical protein
MKTPDFKKLLPYIGAILIFVVITLAYFSPLLEGKRILQSDIINFKGMSKEIVDFREKTGTEPLWTNSMFGGMPAYQISASYTANKLGFIDKVMTLGLPHPANLVFLYFIGFFILLLVMKVDPWLALAGATGFAFSSYFFIIIEAGHNSKAHAIGYMAPVMAGIILTLRRKYIWGGILTAVFLSLEVKANHPQITYYLAMMAVILGIFELIDALRNKHFLPFIKSISVLVIALVFAVLTNLTSLWATYEYGQYTIRGKSELSTEKSNRTSGLDKDYATQWSYGIGETMTLLIPDFYGGSSSAKLSQKSEVVKVMKANNIPDETIRQFTAQPVPFLYWGTQPFTSGPVYIGAIIFFLFFLGLFIVKGPVKWWLLTATLLSIVLAWGHNFMAVTDFFLTYLPGYNKFRAVSMTLVIAEFTMPLLGILALKEIFDSSLDQKKRFRFLQIAFAIAGGTSLAFALVPGLFTNFMSPGDAYFRQQMQLPDWFMQAIYDERMRLLRLDAIRSFAFILIAAGLIWVVLSGKLKKQYAYIGFVVFILADMYLVNMRYLDSDSFTSKSRVETPYSPSQADTRIMMDQDPNFRVLNLASNTFNDAGTSYYHKSLGGYHGAKLRRYQELIEHHITKNNMAVINMLNTRYIIIPDENRNEVVQMNEGALGNAWFVNEVQMVNNADEEINALNIFRPDLTAIVDRKFAGELKEYKGGRDSLDFIKLETYAPNALAYSYHATGDAVAVFSEIYYPKGWNAYVDGKLTPHFRANYVLRAMLLPAGDHKVVFKFEPAVYAVGEKVSLVSSLLLILVTVVFGASEIRRAFRRKV